MFIYGKKYRYKRYSRKKFSVTKLQGKKHSKVLVVRLKGAVIGKMNCN